jgi:hypothetical protein
MMYETSPWTEQLMRAEGSGSQPWYRKDILNSNVFPQL